MKDKEREFLLFCVDWIYVLSILFIALTIVFLMGVVE